MSWMAMNDESEVCLKTRVKRLALTTIAAAPSIAAPKDGTVTNVLFEAHQRERAALGRRELRGSRCRHTFAAQRSHAREVHGVCK
ncbi:hypothetical protein ABIF97_004083 [Bradyrhizobium japonicum]